MIDGLDPIADARRDAAQMEHERLVRQSLAQLAVLNTAIDDGEAALLIMRQAVAQSARALDTIRGIRDHMRDGDWMKSPNQMAAERAAEEQGNAGA